MSPRQGDTRGVVAAKQDHGWADKPSNDVAFLEKRLETGRLLIHEETPVIEAFGIYSAATLNVVLHYW